MMAALYADNEILVQFAVDASPAQRASARASVSGNTVEEIHTAAMKRAATGVLERISVPGNIGVERALAAIARRPGVLSAEPNWRLGTAAVSNDPYYTSGSRLWGMYGDDQPLSTGPVGTTNAFGSQAEKAWDAGFTGSGEVYVGVIDEGIDITHPDLQANVWVNPFDLAGDGLDNDGNGYADDVNGWDFYSGDASVYDGTGDDHGTHVAGTIGGVGGNGIGVAGVNWNVKLISTKFLGVDGGFTSGAIKAVDYLTDLKARHGINIVASSNSWGGGGYSSALHSAIIRGAKQGILFVAAAGNNAGNNDATATFPANYSTLQATSTTSAASYEAVISVAAITESGGLASFSNYGAATVDIGAPGVGILSTLPGGGYGMYSGTSMATPHVSGAAALYASAFPGASAADIRSAILGSSRPTSSLSGKTVTGGRLDVAAALGRDPQVAVSIAGNSVAEGNSGTSPLTFRVTLAAAASGTVTVNYATVDGTAKAGMDYIAASGMLSFAPGETSKTIVVDVIGDATVEPNESLSVLLSSASSNARIQTGTANGTITNDDVATAPALSVNSVSAPESAGTFVFTVTLSSPSTSKVSVRFDTANITATAGRTGDYTATSGMLTFNPGETSKTLLVSVRNDAVAEPDETFAVNLSRASGATIAVAQGIGTILNDDGVTGAARLAAFAAMDSTNDSPTPGRGARKRA